MIRLRTLARQSILLIKLLHILRGVNPKRHIVREGLTRICIEGYPRSANSFAVLMFRMANDNVHIGHHTHSTANVARALRYRIPVVVLVRNPVDAITSWIVAKGGRDIDYRVWSYLAFYRWVEPRINSVVIAKFETVICDFNSVIRQVNDKYGTAFNYIHDLDVSAEQVKQDLRSRFADEEQSGNRFRWMPILSKVLPDALLLPEHRMRGRPRWMAVPDVERERMKQQIHPRVSHHKHIGEAQALYDRLIDNSS